MPPRPIDEIIASIHREGRGPTRERALARQRWFADLKVTEKEAALLELETAIEGVVYLPRSLAAGDRRRAAADGPDRRAETRWIADAMRRGSRRAAELLRTPRRRKATPPPLDPVLVDDPPPSGPREPRSGEPPEEALRNLAHGLDGVEAVARGLAEAPTVGNRAFAALVAMLARDVGRNPHFCPLQPLELRAELDGLDAPWARQSLDELVSESGRRVATKAFLALARARRILAVGLATAPRDGEGFPLEIALSAFRHRVRGIVSYFEDHAGNALADGLEREILLVPAAEISQRAAAIEAGTKALLSLRGSLEGIAVSLLLETRAPNGDDTASVTPVHLRQLDEAIRAVEARLARTLLGEAGVTPVEDEESRDARLRRDAWMFAQVLRGFLAKAGAFTGDTDSWAASASERFVADFLGHFRALGQPLVVETSYPDRGGLRAALATLEETDLLDGPRMQRASAACEAFRTHLLTQFDALAAAPFDRQQAVATLKAYLSSRPPGVPGRQPGPIVSPSSSGRRSPS